MSITPTQQAESIIYGLLDQQAILTLSEIKQAVGPDLPATFAIWNLKNRGDLFPQGKGVYRSRLSVRARDRANELYIVVKRFLETCQDIPEDLSFEAMRLISRIER